ncbi:hypothetical protein Bint_0095 [Brachyspira intermedia PWS/A]|uniref:Uncharacterized protein n=1 Tax=Brachyspira intermedia (strain ATCC 51140 / PWS/A) TaxID=1045858 RepID=G0EPL7_BRAIP|nr:phage tail assembly protein [Brachyspira intermedia]AEM20731.1 hypothetical protein Bint_0095 [Brachyspira intermedia PWS/A]
MNNEIVINLKYPITQGERTVTSLILPKNVLVRHIMAGDPYPQNTVSREVAMLSAMTGEPEIILQNMEITDWVICQAKLNELINNSISNTEEKDNKKNDEYVEEDYIDIINIFRTLILEVMIMSKGLSYDNLINMTIKEFLKWHKESLRIYKVIKGIF